ncbi:hypothetical protein [Euzebya tangerina]|uniref:hypothetical protein n=1 Tax=Euzebya tangerina TaxID=591198 RepID=UPI000E30FAB3|nr:hypothetical protein [Euzebya tangerina]
MNSTIITLWTTLLSALQDRLEDEDGFSTAELLANAALGVAALVVIWGLLSGVGEGVVNQITNALGL